MRHYMIVKRVNGRTWYRADTATLGGAEGKETLTTNAAMLNASPALDRLMFAVIIEGQEDHKIAPYDILGMITAYMYA